MFLLLQKIEHLTGVTLFAKSRPRRSDNFTLPREKRKNKKRREESKGRRVRDAEVGRS